MNAQKNLFMGCLALIMASPFFCSLPGFAAEAPIPSAYADLYGKLERALDDQLQIEAAAKTKPEEGAPLLCTDLLAANSNRGEALLMPSTLQGVILSLDSFHDLGVDCVKFACQYPMLTMGFPRREEYLAFYKQVVAEAHKRNTNL
jgi:hypothetical protein